MRKQPSARGPSVSRLPALVSANIVKTFPEIAKMGLLQEFKTFASRGNVVDLAVGVIIGAAFGKIVSSLVEDLIMPPIGYFTGGIDFKTMKIVLKPAVDKVPEVAINYGNFIQLIVQFLIVAFTIFMMLKAINRLRAPEPPAEPAEPPAQEKLLAEIRDLLKSGR